MIRIFKPGIFRLFLALLVVLFHATKYFPFGNFAVNTFFILSGYWIFRMYDEYYSKQKTPYLTFLWSRILRIYPLYYLCTLLAFIIIAINKNILNHQLIDFLDFNKLFTIISLVPYNYLDEKLLPPAWSLGIEMQFYLLVPLFIYLIKKMNTIIFTLLIALISIVANQSFQFISLSLAPYLIFFIIGMLIWLKKPIVSKGQLIFSLTIILITIGIHYSIPFLKNAIFFRQTIIGGINYMTYFSNILPLLFIPLIIFGLNQKSDDADRRLGDLSYTIYLFHWLPFCIYSYYFANSFLTLRAIAFIVYLVVLAAGSYLIYFTFEKKIEIWRKIILNKR